MPCTASLSLADRALCAHTGKMLEDMELKVRNAIEGIYIQKTREVVNGMRLVNGEKNKVNYPISPYLLPTSRSLSSASFSSPLRIPHRRFFTGLGENPGVFGWRHHGPRYVNSAAVW